MVTKQDEENVGAVSFKPSEMGEGGGLLDDVDVVWKSVRAKMFDYQGKVANPVPAVCITIETEDGETHEQYYSAGDAKNFLPDKDGLRLMIQGSVQKVTGTTNLGLLMASLVSSGYPEDRITPLLSDFDGLKCHMTQVPAPARKGLPQGGGTPRADGRVFEKTVLVVDAIAEGGLPWEDGTGEATAKAATPARAPRASSAAPPAEEVVDKADETVTMILVDNPEGIVKAELLKALFTRLKDDGVPAKVRDAVVQLVGANDEYLNGDHTWTYEGGKVTLG